MEAVVNATINQTKTLPVQQTNSNQSVIFFSETILFSPPVAVGDVPLPLLLLAAVALCPAALRRLRR